MSDTWQFYRIAARALGELQTNFPVPKPISATRIRHAEGVVCDLSLVRATLDWLLDEDYFRGRRRGLYTDTVGSDWEYTSSVLTSKGFTALGVAVEFKSEKLRIGDIIAGQLDTEATETRSRILGYAVDRFLEAAGPAATDLPRCG